MKIKISRVTRQIKKKKQKFNNSECHYNKFYNNFNKGQGSNKIKQEFQRKQSKQSEIKTKKKENNMIQI